MPNQNFRVSHDDVKLDCHMAKAYNCQPTEKLCRFAYASWCPVCDMDVNRKRSKSDCTDTNFRKRGRDNLKSPSPKKTDRYIENRDFPDTKDSHLTSSRVRTNLCELPTSYISNCQPNVPSPDKKPPKKFSDFIDVPYQEQIRCLKAYSSEINSEFASFLNTEKPNGFHKKTNGIKTPRELPQKPPSSAPPPILQPCTPHNPCPLRPRKSSPPAPPVEVANGDCTDLDLKRQRIRTDSDNSNPPPELNDTKGTKKKAREVSPLETKKDTKVKSLIKFSSVKSRHKLSTVKLRKVRNKIAHSVSSDSNLSDSDASETEEEEQSDEEAFKDIIPTTIPSTRKGKTPVNLYTTTSSPPAAQNNKWPVRDSLFAHVPPYINFSSYDSETFILPTGVAKFMKWRLSTITPVIVRKTLTNTGFRLVKNSNDWSGCWGKHMKSVCFQSLKEYQKLNHFPGTFQIGRKDRLWKNLQRLMVKYGHKEFGFIPRTYVLPHDLKALRNAWERTGQEKWIIKPPASARGTGIKVIHRWAHLPKKKSLVVQQYISNPYLINGSKFDLRLYVLVTSFNPLRIYLYPDGLARFASTKYSDDISSLSDRYMHLTNYSINKLSSQYTANEDANACKGHKWTISKLWEYMESKGIDTKSLWSSLQQLVIKTIISGESSITQLCKGNIPSRYNCYELFGIDVLLDDKLKPWLLEVNISPSLHSASPLDLHVKGPLVQTLLNVAQFHLPKKVSRLKNSPSALNSDLYTVNLTTKERVKQSTFMEYETRPEYLHDILEELTGDDVRHLIQAEDELTVIGNFERIFPTKYTHDYLQYMEMRYYNRLFDAWESKYEDNRKPGIKRLQTLCEQRVHLEVAPSPVTKDPLNNETTTTESPVPSSASNTKSRPETSGSCNAK